MVNETIYDLCKKGEGKLFTIGGGIINEGDYMFE